MAQMGAAQEGQTAGFGPYLHFPGQPILVPCCFLSHSHNEALFFSKGPKMSPNIYKGPRKVIRSGKCGVEPKILQKRNKCQHKLQRARQRYVNGDT